MRILTPLKRIPAEIQYICLLFLATRLALTLLGVCSRLLLETQKIGKPAVWSSQLWLDIWGVWDARWYMNIATQGYTVPAINSTTQTNLVFFPLYPGLMHLLGKATGGEYFLAGIVISNVCLLLSCWLLVKLIGLEDASTTAQNAVKYLFLFPSAFVLSGVFTESLYLCLVLTCFYLAKQQRWQAVGMAGFLLALTRSLGVFILLPLLYEYFKSIQFKLNKIQPALFWLLLIPLGLFTFATYNYHLTGDFFFFKTNQVAWKREAVDPISAIGLGFSQGYSKLLEASFQQGLKKLLEVFSAVVALLLLNLSYRQIGFSYWLFGMYSILIPMTAEVDSMPRFLLPVFPLYIVLAKLANQQNLNEAMTLFLGILQGGLMIFWVSGFSLVV